MCLMLQCCGQDSRHKSGEPQGQGETYMTNLMHNFCS